MGDSLNQVLFVEFFGLPGCGKSTVSHLLAERLRAEGFKVSEPSYGIDHQIPIWRKIRKLLLGLYYYIFCRSMYDAVKEIVSKNDYKETEAFAQIVNIMQKVDAYHKNHVTQFVIWDQGLVQAAISLSLLGKENADNNLRKLIDLLPSSIRTHNVLIDIDENLALQRMSMRSTNDSRVEKIKDGGKKIVLLHRFQEGVCSIKENHLSIEVDGSMSLKRKVEQLYTNVLRQISV